MLNMTHHTQLSFFQNRKERKYSQYLRSFTMLIDCITLFFHLHRRIFLGILPGETV